MSTEYQHSDWFVPRRQSFVPNARRVTGQLVFVGKIWERTFFDSPGVGHRINRPHASFTCSYPQVAPLLITAAENRRHITMLRLPLRESLHLGEYPPKKFRWRTLPAPFTNSLQPLDAKRIAVCIERVRQSVGEKQHRISRVNPDFRYVVRDRGIEQSRRYPLNLQHPAVSRRKMQGTWHARARDLHLLRSRIEHRILHRRVPRIIRRRFKIESTAAGDCPFLCNPRSVPTASAAYMAAGRPLPDTSPRYKPIQPSVSSK